MTRQGRSSEIGGRPPSSVGECNGADPGADPQLLRRPGLRSLLVVLAVSTVLKAGLIWPAGLLRPVGDEHQYLAGMWSIVREGTPSYFQPSGWDPAHAAPVLPYSLAAVYAVAGRQWFKPAFRCVQVLLSALTVLALYVAVRRSFGRRHASISAAVAAFFPPLIGYTQLFLTETIYIFFLVAFVAVLVSGPLPPPARRAFAAGLLAAGATLTRSVLVPQILLVLLWFAVTGRAAPGKRAAAAGAFLLGFCLVLAPWSAFASTRYQGFVLVDTNLGNVLFRNVNASPPENYDIGLRHRWFRWRRDFSGWPPVRDRVEVENVADRQNAEIRAALRYIAAYPGHYLRNCGIRAMDLMNPTSFVVLRLRLLERAGHLGPVAADALVCVTVLSIMLVLFWGTVGFVSVPLRGRALLPALLIFGHAAVCLALAAMSRYRLPILPLLIPFAVHGVVRWRLVFAPRSRQRWFLVGPLLLFLLAVWYLYLPYNFPSDTDRLL